MDRIETPLDYTQKSTRSTLALKLSVAPPVYLWLTATLRMVLESDPPCSPAIIKPNLKATTGGLEAHLHQAYTVSTKRKYTLAAKPSTQNRGGLEEK